jgi:small conductance mechanosensitive channel
LRGDEDSKERMRQTATALLHSTYEQFAGILIREPSVEGIFKLKMGKEFLRIKFRIWPNRGGPIESSFVRELTAELTHIDPDYQPWMISINYEVEKRSARPREAWPWLNRKPETAAFPSKSS